MSDGKPVRVRALPSGEPSGAMQVAVNGRFLEIEFPGPDEGPSIGELLEIEDGPVVSFGEILQRNGGTVKVLIDHSIDLTKLPSVLETWG